MATAATPADGAVSVPPQESPAPTPPLETPSDQGNAQTESNSAGSGATMSTLAQPSALMDGLRDMMGHQNVRRGIPILIAVVVLLIMATMYSSMTPDSFRAVYPGMEESDRQLALEELDENGFKASIDAKSGNLMVPSDKYHQARIFLSSKGIPQKPVIGGFQSLNEQSSMTTSHFMEQARYVNAVENELARSVGEISTIQSARVHLALPKQSVFVRDRKPAKASVVVTPYPGRGVDSSQVQAIVHLVSMSVPNLLPTDVAVVDHYGNLLTDNALDPAMGLSAKQLAHKQHAEDTYRSRIMQLLSPVVGQGNVRSQVNIDMNFTQVETTLEDFDTRREGPKTRSEVLAEDRTYRPDPQGIPGSYSNTPPPDARLEADGMATAEEPPAMRETISSRTTRNYELDRRVRHVKNPTGIVDRVSVAVVINERDGSDIPEDEGSGGYTKAELESLTSLIQGVIGFNENRGDVVTLIPAKFEVPADPSVVPWHENDSIMDAIKLAVMALLFLMILLTVIRPIVKSFVGPSTLDDQLEDESEEEHPEEVKDGEEGEGEESEDQGEESEDEGDEGDEEEDEDDDDDAEEDDTVEFEEGESLEDIKAKLKPKKSSISLDMLDTANSYDDKLAIIRLLVSEDSGRVATVLKKMIDE